MKNNLKISPIDEFLRRKLEDEQVRRFIIQNANRQAQRNQAAHATSPKPDLWASPFALGGHLFHDKGQMTRPVPGLDMSKLLLSRDNVPGMSAETSSTTNSEVANYAQEQVRKKGLDISVDKDKIYQIPKDSVEIYPADELNKSYRKQQPVIIMDKSNNGDDFLDHNKVDKYNIRFYPGNTYKFWQTRNVPGYKNDIFFNFAPIVPPMSNRKQDQSFYDNGLPGFTASSTSSHSSYRNTPECASNVTYAFLDKMGPDFVVNNNVRGDAWTMPLNLEKKGYEFTNIFDDAPFSVKSGNRNIVNNFVYNHYTKEWKDGIREELKPGDIVTLLYPTSPNYKKAAVGSGGRILSTHIGYVEEKDGKLYIVDNVHGTVKYHPLESLLTNAKGRKDMKITGFVNIHGKKEKPTFYNDMTEQGFVPDTNSGAKFYRLMNNSAYRSAQSIIDNSYNFLKIKGVDSDTFNRLRKIAFLLQTKESMNGVGDRYLETAGLTGTYKDKIVSKLQNLRRIYNGTVPSISLSNIKVDSKKFLEGLSEKEKEIINYDYAKAHGLLETPEFSGNLTMLYLIKQKQRLSKILKTYKVEELNDNKELMDDLIIAAHNQGWLNIIKNISKYSKNKDIGELTQYSDISYVKGTRIFEDYFDFNPAVYHNLKPVTVKQR